MLLHYFDAAADRLGRRRRGDFEAWIEAVRLGTLFAHDAKAYGRWQRSKGSTAALPPDRLETAVMQLAQSNPEYIVVGA